jgi:3-mercaptopyruvate sulfurtransferase SseA
MTVTSQRKKWIALYAGLILCSVTLACNVVLPQQEINGPAVPAFPTEDPYIEVPRVELEEAKIAFDSKSVVFVDVRTAESYAQSHIPGALSIPGTELEGRMDELDPEKWIITYCT